MKNFLITFFAASCSVWLIFSLIWGWIIVAYNYHWPVIGLFFVSLMFSVFEVLCEQRNG